MQGLIGRKLGMTRVFNDDGRVEPVTVIEAGPCPVLRVRAEAGAPPAAQLGFGVRRAKRTTRAVLGHAKTAGLEAAPAVLRELPVSADGEAPKPGDVVTVAIFQPGDLVKVIGTTKGRGFQGVVKRHGFSGGPKTHGSKTGRIPGSIGNSAYPGRVIPGTKLPGQMGNVRVTVQNLTVVGVDAEQNLIWVKGSVPGARNGYLTVTGVGSE
jgi:large subunit ribosomal protein L3